MHAERTPNPHSIKWVLADPLVPPAVSASYASAVGEDVSPLAARLFRVRGVEAVFFTANFVTVTKSEVLDWQDLAEPLVESIKAFVASGASAVGPEFEPAGDLPGSEVEGRIRRILEDEVRPALAMDGGDVVFAGFSDGVVEVHLQGACVGCPSSTATLRFAVEGRLREEIPEVTKVVAI